VAGINLKPVQEAARLLIDLLLVFGRFATHLGSLMKLSLGKSDGDNVRVLVSGKITQHDFGPVQEPLEALVGPGVYARQIELDMSDATYMDSSGVGWLLTCHKRVREAGGRLTVAKVQPIIANMLRLLKLSRIFGLDGPTDETTPEAGGLS
jgi:anti-sigma B factor antagonist